MVIGKLGRSPVEEGLSDFPAAEACEYRFDEVRGEGGSEAVEFGGVGSEGLFGEDGDEGIHRCRCVRLV